MMSPVQRSA
uniref:Uncharacterized protein n=1 Tax=Oryza barthii TaxID=65489 RepID=A0A0G2KBL7_9ORYZ